MLRIFLVFLILSLGFTISVEAVETETEKVKVVATLAFWEILLPAWAGSSSRWT